MNKIDVAGVKINNITKKELLNSLSGSIANKEKKWIITIYSETLLSCMRNGKLKDLFNRADFIVPDGIGIFWAKKFLDLPFTARRYWTKILQALWQIKYSLAAIIFNPKWIKSAFAEKISGSELVWDLADLAAKNNWSIYFLGGFGDTAKLASEKINVIITHGRELLLQNKKLIAGYSNKNPGDPTIVNDINKASPDMLFVAYGPVKQEKWIAENLSKLDIKLAIGLGGTFDYIAGKKSNPPKFIRKAGFEWLFRLFTQPYRIKRIWQAIFGLCKGLLRYKIFLTYPLRDNVVVVVVNSENKILVGKKKPDHFKIDIINDAEAEKRKNYWQLPQGGTDGETDLFKTAAREAEEELGLKNLEPVRISNLHYEYIWNNTLRKLISNRNYKNKGQRQSFVYVRFNGNNSEIILREEEEFSEYKWVMASELGNIIHPERHAMIKIIQTDLKEMAEKGIINIDKIEQNFMPEADPPLAESKN